MNKSPFVRVERLCRLQHTVGGSYADDIRDDVANVRDTSRFDAA